MIEYKTTYMANRANIKEDAIFFLNKNKEKLFGILALPQKGSNFPAVIICHGFGKTKSERKFVDLSRALAKKRMASLRFDFSGQGDSEGDFQKLSIEGQVKDLEAAYNTLCQNKKIDKARIAVLGHSLGALIAVLFQVKCKKAKTLILVSLALHQRGLVQKWYTKEQIALWKKQGYLDIPKGRVGLQYLKEAQSRDWSKIATQIIVPTLILHGRDDKDVSWRYAKDLFTILSGKKKKLEIVPLAEHQFEGFEAKNKLIKICSQWLKGCL